MTTVAATELLAELIERKTPEIKALLELREAIAADEVHRRSALDALDGWDASLERQGILLYLLGQVERALKVLRAEARSDCAKYFLALAQLDAGFHADGAEFLAGQFAGEKSLEYGMPLFRAQVMQGDLEAAAKTLKALSSNDNPAVRAAEVELTYRQGDLQGAIDAAEELSEAYPDNRHVSFAVGLVAQAAGDDRAARRAYERVCQTPPVAVDVLINLGTLYEDEGAWELASKCYETVLRHFPTHKRARLYLHDTRASMNMFYDEDRERKEDKRLQVLRTPVTDFELSVRSRNCLSKMRIETLGDLIIKSESELLSYKNFGETSLQEIKGILASKGLRLGMRTEEALAYAPPAPGEEPVPVVDDKLLRGIETLELSVRSRRCMDRVGIRTVGELVAKTEAELLSAPNFGQTSLNEVRQKLAELSLALAG